MATCQDTERLLTPYLDEEAAPADRAAVEAHLAACAACARRASAESTVRRVLHVRARQLVAPAPPALRARCAGLALRQPEVSASAGAWFLGWRGLSLAGASLVVLALCSVLVYGAITHSPAIVVAELTLDHLKCFALFEPSTPAASSQSVAAQLQADYGWRLPVPGSLARERLTLLGARRCYSTDGSVAHVLYRHGGRPLSLFMMSQTARGDAQMSIAGHVARMWSRGATTFVLVASETAPDIQPIAKYFESARY
ncbi:MAG TPA: zf-HC2 domain-containing protein [Vicinamibacterales bacterium]|jgi:anti-sigma factor (TIGR02949 family)